MAWENKEMFEDATESQTKIDKEFKSDEADHDKSTGGEDICCLKSVSSDPLSTYPAEKGHCVEGCKECKVTVGCVIIIGLGTIAMGVATLCLCLSVSSTKDIKFSYNGPQNDTTKSTIPLQNATDTQRRPQYQALSQADDTTIKLWMKAEYISTNSEYQILWRSMSTNNGSATIQLTQSSIRFRVPISGEYNILASFQVMGRMCRSIRNSNYISIRLCIQHEHKLVKCIKESFPMSSAEWWVRTLYIIVPALSMEAGNTVSFVNSNPDCIYDDPKVSLIEIHRIH
ncbi:uncharacterized protein LOC110458351 [Mizuhopecten yessoensis]|uniref:Uncharacterized protein n=1 Tax=Mizuhopecten yessoensis TaxID=6573 RepID=A0A210Q6Q3_MIZYE|nr:uncharacterized protein LOC110458351 [Mizuhopecten yessoensis]OWF44422.1 hypothetical protein KP79_PYT20491 [Mizuhopecten yessoensis]